MSLFVTVYIPCWAYLSVLRQTIYSSVWSSFAACTEPQNQPERRDWGLFRSFLSISITCHSMWHSRFSGICWSFSKSSMDISFPSFSFFSFWSPAAAVLNNCCLLFSTNALGMGIEIFSLSELWVLLNLRLDMRMELMELFIELPDRSNNNNYLGMRLWGSFKSVLSPPVMEGFGFF